MGLSKRPPHHPLPLFPLLPPAGPAAFRCLKLEPGPLRFAQVLSGPLKTSQVSDPLRTLEVLP